MRHGLGEGEVSLDTSRVDSLTYSFGESIEVSFLVIYIKLCIKRLRCNRSEDSLIQRQPVKSWTSFERHQDLRKY